MELLQLKYFCDAARQENFSKTAAKFRVPPSNISQSVKRLEGELGVKLFERRANSITLSESGRAFFERASRALEIIEEGKNAVSHPQVAGRIKILATSVRRLVMQTVERFKRAYPSVEISLCCDVREDAEDFDVVVSGDDFSHRMGAGEVIVEERMLLAVNRNHPLAKKSRITAADIKDESFVSMGKESNLFHVCEKICRELGFSPDVSIRCDDPYYVRRCVELSLGVAIVPEVSWRGLFGSDATLRPFCDYTRNTFVYVNEKKEVSASALDFVEMLKDECRRELVENR